MQTGKKLGRYEIRKKIGSGGMGEVYLARDEQLDRNVALKVLLPEFCCDLERVRRFKMEAKAASALSHPNIITIHEIDELDDRLFITTEFVDGKTLREKIQDGELTLYDSVWIAEQIAEALAVAHEAGIVHRDIKPENVMIRRDGYVKILDFGLAKPTLLKTAAGTEDETVRMVQTQPGMVMGSVRYMSPEQARGKETDERTDVWSLGVVLYEMLTGINPFEGETISDSLAALIHVEPQPIEDLPEELQWILRKTLKKNAAERYQSIKDFALDLKDLRQKIERNSTENRTANYTKAIHLSNPDTSENKTLIHRTLSAETNTGVKSGDWSKTQANTTEARRKRSYLPLGALALAMVLAFGAWYFLPSLLAKNSPAFEEIQIKTLTENGQAFQSAVSPNGKMVAFVHSQDGRESLVVKQISGDNSISENSIEAVAPTSLKFQQPTFSPDDASIYYVLNDNGVGTLYRVSAFGGQSKKIIVDIDSPATLSPDGKQFAFIRHNPFDGGDTIFFADTSDGANLKPFISTKEAGYDKFTAVAWSPDNRALLIGAFKGEGEPNFNLKIATVNLTDKSIRALGEKNWYGAHYMQWINKGEGVVFVGKENLGDNSQIWYLSYPSGEVRQITNDTSNYDSLSVSSDGTTLIATKYDTISSFWTLSSNPRELKQLTGESKTLIGYLGVSQSPDGRILYSKTTGKEINIFAMDEKTPGVEKQLTADSRFNSNPIATPDGRYIVFISNRKGAHNLWRMNADGTNPVQITNEPNFLDTQFQITNDSKTIIFTRNKADGSRMNLMKVSIDGGEAVPLIPENTTSVHAPQISADGKLFAYHTFTYDEKTAKVETGIKITNLDGGNVSQQVAQLDIGLNSIYKFTPDGKALTYINRSGVDNLWNISTSDKKETPLTDFKSGNISNFVWSRDGKKLIIVRGIVNSDLVLIKDKRKAA